MSAGITISTFACQRCGDDTHVQHYPECFVALEVLPFEPLLCGGCDASMRSLFETAEVSCVQEAHDTVKAWYLDNDKGDKNV